MFMTPCLIGLSCWGQVSVVNGIAWTGVYDIHYHLSRLRKSLLRLPACLPSASPHVLRITVSTCSLLITPLIMPPHRIDPCKPISAPLTPVLLVVMSEALQMLLQIALRVADFRAGGVCAAEAPFLP
ncbi:hypothetical protein NEOLEDRAFT_937483 [Neolentinus lepideus HHB14362 ss-1]|uniref:Uncharacterized protein n=1 Tax=Neolentinus lepideus HHB14362 ss-1 TaxID=1314782 RepID=A0A165NH38_9AGAM|nr:hypothetical protein NEOLEDRAFT_937483 [Neolentinus lepideus HHB14362 ss-1]